jgi:outer membrane biosynthesis protein TonB
MHRFLAACSLLFLLPFPSRAAFISEVAWAGSSASLADEWIEICGAPGDDLSGWSIEGASASPIAIPSGTAIPASGAFVVANYASDDPRSTLAATPDLVTTTVALSNSALFIALRDAGGNVIDVAGAPGTAPYAGTSGETKASMARIGGSADGGLPEAWIGSVISSGFDVGASELGTPGACEAPAEEEAPEQPAESATSTDETAEEDPPHQPPAPAEPMSAVRVSEIYPSPLSGEKEWLELVNLSSVGEFLDGMTVEDAQGSKTPLAGLLLPWARLVIEAPKGSLNNDGDIVVLRDRFGRAADRVEYPKTAKGAAYMRIELQGAFAMTVTPTPGAPNALTEGDAEADAPVAPTVADPPAPVSPPASSPSAPPLPPGPERSVMEESFRPETVPTPSIAAGKKEAPATKAKPTAKPAKKTAASRYKGSSYRATVVVPPGVYAKTRGYVLLDGTIRELRLSKGPSDAWNVGDAITFVAQEKSEGAVAFLLANPNSVRTVGSASATFATAETWPDVAGGYRFTAEVASVRGSAVEVTLGGVDGDVLAPTGSVSALKPGDTIRVEGFIAPGPRPQVMLPHAQALRLELPKLADAAAPASRARLPAPAAIALTALAAGAGIAAYLRMHRLKRAALTQTPIEEGAWE